MKQLKLFETQIPKSFGGEELNGRRKSARPLSKRHPVHLTLKSSQILTKGGFFRRRKWVRAQMEKVTTKWRIKIFEHYIGGNHIHLAIQIPNREAYVGFIRALTGILARSFAIAFDHRQWTRIVTWGRDFKNLCHYIRNNFRESIGLIRYVPRGRDKVTWLRRNSPPTYEDWMDALA